MTDKPYLITTGVLFGLITLGHLIRLSLQLPMQIGSWSVPFWPSLIAVVLAAAMCLWAFRLLRSR